MRRPCFSSTQRLTSSKLRLARRRLQGRRAASRQNKEAQGGRQSREWHQEAKRRRSKSGRTYTTTMSTKEEHAGRDIMNSFAANFLHRFTLPFCLATDIDITDRRTVMHKSADLPTARMLPMVAGLDIVRQYSTILICIAFSKVGALRHTLDCCSDPVSGPTASLDSSAVSVWTHVWLVAQATRRKTTRTKKKKKREPSRPRFVLRFAVFALF
jgi:hypothetical protein